MQYGRGYPLDHNVCSFRVFFSAGMVGWLSNSCGYFQGLLAGYILLTGTLPKLIVEIPGLKTLFAEQVSYPRVNFNTHGSDVLFPESL
jgi:hypothetical protein